MNERSARTVIILWSLVMIGLSLWIPAGYWTIDDSIKSISATQGEGAWGSPIADGILRARLSNPTDYPVLVPPFAERIEKGVAPGFSPYARLLAHVESQFSRRAMMVMTTIIAIGVGWTLYGAGLSWGFLLLPLTFYGLVPWEHGIALCMSVTALVGIFLKDRITAQTGIFFGALLAGAAAFRLEHSMLLLASVVYLLFEKRYRDSLVVAISGAVTGTILIAIAGADEMLRQSTLNQLTSAFSFTNIPQSLQNTLFAMGPSLVVSILLCAALLFALDFLNRKNSPRVLGLIAWGGVGLFALVSVKLVWDSDYPPLAMLATGSFAFALPWVLWLFFSKAAWKTKAMAYATAVLVVGILLLPQSSGVHWGPRLLLFTAPLFLIALYRAGLQNTKAFTALVLLGLVQSVNSGLLVQQRYVESEKHIIRLAPLAGSPMVTTSRAQAIDLAPLWSEEEFFVASTPDELKNLLVEFYLLRQDSVWLHLPATDSLFVLAFPENKPVWPHRMTVVNSGGLFVSQWRLYQLVMNRADPSWIPLLEQTAGEFMLQGDTKRALFMTDDVIRIDPTRASAHSNMGFILARMGKNTEARSAALRALELDSTLIQAREILSRLDSLSSVSAE